MQNRLKADIMCLVETQTKPKLVPCTFSLRDKVLRGKELTVVLSNNVTEIIWMRQ